MLSASFFEGNRERLRQLFTGTAPIVLTANGLMQRGGDESYPFHQDSNFWYLTGIDVPDVLLVLDKDKEYLIVPGRSDVREAFDGALDTEAFTRRSGITTVLDEKEGWKQLHARLRRVQHVATLAPPTDYIDAYGMYTNPARRHLIRRMKEANEHLELLDLRMHLARMRMIKQPVELEQLQSAIDITLDTLKEITRPSSIGKYAHEYEIEADLSRGFRRRGASGHAFSPIVASGKRACTLHNFTNNGILAADELAVLDVGAEVEHYAADITRTVALGKPSRRQQLVHEAVLEAQMYAISLLKPGVLIKAYEQQMEAFVGEKLRELGLVKSITSEAVRRYFPHATSHFLGLDTHDVGHYERPLEPGVVITAEPGIYIPEESIGVRIEDDVLITAEGNTVLSAKLPRAL
ncbi:MAG TPA: Xaa-Pro aminopeptidase [Candidatus Saccharimonadales bacterium]|jgi:Xaa-Pro aminopeptidase|nr:Xaa-Pro aminopeptidase [Candidatus Saccharimonadales bacterium]